jgi:hypothetical protein
MNELSILIETIVIRVLVNQNKGKLKENLKLQNAVSQQLMDTVR